MAGWSRSTTPRSTRSGSFAAPYHRPVMIHTADPGAFFTPLDAKNERWHELNDHPDWLFHGKDFPRRAELHAQRLPRDRPPSQDHVHLRPPGQRRRGPGGRGRLAGQVSEHVRGYRRPDLRTGPTALFGPTVLDQVSGSRPLRHRHHAEPRLPTGCTFASSKPTTSISTRPAAIIARASG